MSEFKQAILYAKKQQRKKQLFFMFGALLVAVVLLSLVFISTGTRIEVLPKEISADANVSASSPLAFVMNDRLYSLAGKTAIYVEANGFKPVNHIVSEQDYGTVTTVKLEPLPGRLFLTSSAGDDNTSWYLNDEIVAVASKLEKEVPAGEYSLRLSHPFYTPENRVYEIGRGKVIEEMINLEPLQGQFKISSAPPGAAVIINGESRGQTPLTLSLAGGKYIVEVTKDGFDPTTDSIQIKNGELKPTRNYRLSAKSAGVTVSVSPADGLLTLNGVAVSSSGKIKVMAGQKSRLSYSKSGYFSQSSSFSLMPDEVKHFEFALKKEMGQVDVIANVPSQVYVNGKKVGTTPLELTLNAAPQNIEVMSPGYRSVKRTLTPNAASPSKVDAVMVPEGQARLAESPSSYKTKAGGEMVLFKVKDKVVMGAERGEPGQRANEFIRTAQITKPFYAGRHEVTNGAYAKFKSGHSGQANEPVTNVSWIDAAKYANWLSQSEGLQEVYVISGSRLAQVNSIADGYRLLTEAEWEWLARKARRSSQTQFAWGSDTTLPRKAANVADVSAKGTAKVYVPRYDDAHTGVATVMSMKKEVSGLFDMGGNVSEWTHDGYVLVPPAKGAVVTHELDRSTIPTRVVKGGNYLSGSTTELRASYRDGRDGPDKTTGFRLGRFVFGGK